MACGPGLVVADGLLMIVCGVWMVNPARINRLYCRFMDNYNRLMVKYFAD